MCNTVILDKVNRLPETLKGARGNISSKIYAPVEAELIRLANKETDYETLAQRVLGRLPATFNGKVHQYIERVFDAVAPESSAQLMAEFNSLIKA